MRVIKSAFRHYSSYKLLRWHLNWPVFLNWRTAGGNNSLHSMQPFYIIVTKCFKQFTLDYGMIWPVGTESILHWVIKNRNHDSAAIQVISAPKSLYYLISWYVYFFQVYRYLWQQLAWAYSSVHVVMWQGWWENKSCFQHRFHSKSMPVHYGMYTGFSRVAVYLYLCRYHI